MTRSYLPIFALCSIAAVSATGTGASASDLRRARTKVPGDIVRGKGHGEMVLKLNVQLQRNFHHVRPCENFTVRELIDVQRQLHQHRDPSLNAIYLAAMDNRRLGAFGHVAEDLEKLEALWAEESAILDAHPKLHDMSRDAKCHEAVMWMVHHIPDASKAVLKTQLSVPLLPVRSTPHEELDFAGAAPTSAVKRIFEGYSAGIGCAACHASGQTVKNTESKMWPAEVVYTATGHGAFPFWDNGGPGCSHCDPSVDGSSQLKVLWSSKLNSEILMHSSCGDMSWTEAADAPNKSPCNHIFTPDQGAFIYTPKSSLSVEADGKFCCRTVPAGDTQFPGAVPKSWMRSMNYWGTAGPYKGDHYTGDVKIYWYAIGGLDFWYYETPDGKPVDQGEGCYFPGIDKKKACGEMMPIVVWHEFDQFNETTYTSADFTVPDICKSTTTSCTIPGAGPPPELGAIIV